MTREEFLIEENGKLLLKIAELELEIKRLKQSKLPKVTEDCVFRVFDETQKNSVEIFRVEENELYDIFLTCDGYPEVSGLDLEESEVISWIYKNAGAIDEAGFGYLKLHEEVVRRFSL
jgi:hypothetical protein